LLLFITFIPISLVNPYGFSLWTGIYNELSLTRVDVPEWWSVWKSLKNSENTVSTVFFLVFGVAALASSIIFDVKKYGSKILLLTTFVVGCLVVRHQSIFYLVAGCYLPSLFKFQLKSYYLVLILIGAIVSAVNKDIRNIFTLSEESELPIAAVAKIKNEICPANIVTELDWGSYLSWQFDGACKVAIDGRYGTVFDEEVLRDYFSLVDGKLDSNFLKKYPTNYALFRVANSVSVDFMQNPEWSLAYHDAKAKLFVRK